MVGKASAASLESTHPRPAACDQLRQSLAGQANQVSLEAVRETEAHTYRSRLGLPAMYAVDNDLRRIFYVDELVLGLGLLAANQTQQSHSCYRCVVLRPAVPRK
jgi:hypothetical protein